MKRTSKEIVSERVAKSLERIADAVEAILQIAENEQEARLAEEVKEWREAQEDE